MHPGTALQSVPGVGTRPLQTACCQATFRYGTYPYFNAVAILYHFPTMNCGFENTVIWGLSCESSSANKS